MTIESYKKKVLEEFDDKFAYIQMEGIKTDDMRDARSFLSKAIDEMPKPKEEKPFGINMSG